MEYQLENKVVDITLKLSLEEFNTIVASFGASEYEMAEDVAHTYGWKIMGNKQSNKLYSELKKIAIANR